MSEAASLVESEDLVLVRDSRAACCRTRLAASRAVTAAKDAAALKDMWRKAALQGWLRSRRRRTRWDLPRPSC